MLTRVLLALTSAVLLGIHAPAADANAERTRKLIEILQSNAAFYDKARACQQLSEIGTKEAIPALAALLDDEHLSAYARSGLEGIPDPTAAEALRNAATRLTGDRLAGLVESLGVLCDPNAVELLHKLADDPTSEVSQKALLALGRIANEASISILRECLAKGSEGSRTNVAAALLIAAQKQLVDGRAQQATSLYDLVRRANVPVLYRAGALRGAIVARNAEGVPLLVEQLQSNEPVLRNAALTAIREIPCEELAGALNTEIDHAPAELQKLLLVALVDCHNAQSLQLLGRKATDAAPEIRQTALMVMGRIGDASEVPVLIAAMAQNRRVEESSLAQSALGRIQSAGVNEELVHALASSTDLQLRTRLIRVLATRSATNAVSELLKQAAGPDVKVSVAALNALQSLAGPSEMPALIALTRDAKDATVREATENALAGACLNTGSALAGTEAVLTELKQAKDPAVENSWVNVLISLGEPKSLPAVLVAVNDPNTMVAGNALEELARWPDPEPMESLLAIVQNADPSRRKRALASAIRLATVAADEHQRPPATLVRWFREANTAAGTVEEQRLIVSALGRVPELESLQLLLPYLNHPDLKEEAAVAVVQIAPALQKEDSPALKEALDRIAATATNRDLRDRASKLAKSMPSQSTK